MNRKPSGIAPGAGCTIEDVVARVPDDGGDVVFATDASNKIVVSPPRCGFGMDWAYEPFPDDDWNVREVSSQLSKVVFELGNVLFGAPDRAAPSGRGEGILNQSEEVKRNWKRRKGILAWAIIVHLNSIRVRKLIIGILKPETGSDDVLTRAAQGDDTL